ncbi:MAG: hypothetical protein JNJ88_03450 [Planctomycetes bacterium]|nr:hypothetical protein [Planctomycetota bacterium]
MSERKPFLLRLDEKLYEELRRWADDELRSVNGQIEFLLRRAVEERRRRADSGEVAPTQADLGRKRGSSGSPSDQG